MVDYPQPPSSHHQEPQVDFADSPSDVESANEQDKSHGAHTRNGGARDDGPACQQCRKKKAKCTRTQPCSQCARNNLTCMYDEKKNKPGVRTGAMEQLSQRLATLETMFLGQGVLWQHVWQSLDAVSTTQSKGDENLEERSRYMKRLFTSLGDGSLQAESLVDKSRDEWYSPSKRRKVQGQSASTLHHDASTARHPIVSSPESSPGAAAVTQSAPAYRLPDDLVASLVDIYFERVHHWIPMLHVVRFRQRLRMPQERARLGTTASAIVSLCLRFSSDPRLGGTEARQSLVDTCRQHVILQSMEQFSVDHLQALIICAFDTIGSGRGPTSWSIIGSLVRTVEQLGLSVEDEKSHVGHGNAKVLVRRINFLPPCRDWVEVEERRRVFWNAFLMDRFCCIATGWNLSLTSADVKRRLPCEGSIWEKGDAPATPTPYFGVSDKANNDLNEQLTVSRDAEGPRSKGGESLGGFAYCIEATESLSLVTSFFLQREVDVTKSQDLQLFLMRFKELDLRLIHWKMFLPIEWREACATNVDGNMDPNLTLAHVTHNTAVVLLHQSIAYPPDGWQAIPIKLPSESSADTCLAAAREVVIITDNFLRHSPIPTNPQFSFCLFVCARMLVHHAGISHNPLPTELHKLVGALEDISRRWNGSHGPGHNLASKFASRLAQVRGTGSSSSLDIRHEAYADDDHIEEGDFGGTTPNMTNAHKTVHTPFRQHFLPTHQHTGLEHRLQRDSPSDLTSLAFPPLPQSLQAFSNANQEFLPPPPPQPQESLPIITAADSIRQQADNRRNPINSMLNGPPESAAAPTAPVPFADDHDFQDLSSYFIYSFHPEERVTNFSDNH